MAKVVLGLGTSHTPMLLAYDETLLRFVETDQQIKHRDKEGRPVTYGDLLEKADPKLAHMVAPEHLVARQNVAREAIAHLQEVVAGTSLDALIVMGDDQNVAVSGGRLGHVVQSRRIWDAGQYGERAHAELPSEMLRHGCACARY